MKKVIIALVMGVGIAQADVAVEFVNNAGVVTTDGATFVDQALAQLIWSATYDAGVNLATPGGGLSAGEFVLAQLTTTSGFAGTWSDQPIQSVWSNANVGGADINDGYLFVRILNNDAMGAGDNYLQQWVQGPPLTVFNNLDPATEYSTLGQLGGNIGASTFQVIPEPATALMLILGGMGAWIFRRSKLQSQQEEAA